MKHTILHSLAAVLLTTGIVLVVSSDVGRLLAALLSGQESTVLPIEQSSLHAAAQEAPTAPRQLIMGILLILLGLGMYVFQSIRNRDTHRSSPRKTKTMTLIRASSHRFWIG